MTERPELKQAEIVVAVLRAPPRLWPRLFPMLARASWRDARFRMSCWRYGYDPGEIRRLVRIERLIGGASR